MAKLKNKKVVTIPKDVKSVVISFRTIKRKGKMKNAAKANVPRAAKQVVVKMRKAKTVKK